MDDPISYYTQYAKDLTEKSEKVHMRPIINRVKLEFDDCRIIFVADRGLNTSDDQK